MLKTLRNRFKEVETPESINSQEVQGKRSPRWAIWSRMLIPCKSGEHYLARLRIVQTPWFGIYLHDIFEDDGDRDPHNHPWSFCSIVLRGHYLERVYPEPLSDPFRCNQILHKRFSAHLMGTKSAHRIVETAPGLKTLILTGPRQSGWGFFKLEQPSQDNPPIRRYVSWQDYEREQVVANPKLAVQ